MWILILTMTMTSQGYRAGAAISSVPGFTNEAACMAAAAAWLAQKTDAEYVWTKKTALCAKT